MAIKVNRADLAADHSARVAWHLSGIMSEFAEAIFKFYEACGFSPSSAEREGLLTL